jgi:hypothetical protein
VIAIAVTAPVLADSLRILAHERDQAQVGDRDDKTYAQYRTARFSNCD